MHTLNKHALSFGLFSVFLTGLGFTIINPVVPFLLEPYTSSQNQPLVISFLTSIYALCTFLTAPALGTLSDRYGRKPILLFCLLGSALGYLIFGMAGALWLFFLGRIIDGISGGNIATLFAYFSDITPAASRTKIFGWISALVGVGTLLGPTFGGLLAHYGNRVPFYFAAVLSLFNLLYGLFFMPESLSPKERLIKLDPHQLYPFAPLKNLFEIKQLNRLFLAALLLWLPNGALQAIVAQFSLDNFSWQPVQIGLLFSIMGLQDIFSQALIMPFLLKKLTDQSIIKCAIVAELFGYIFMAVSAFTLHPFYFIIGIFIYGFGDSIFAPPFNGTLSKSVTEHQQGQIQGSSQALQALTRILGPIIGGQLYVLFGSSAPACMGVILLIVALTIFKTKNRQK